MKRIATWGSIAAATCVLLLGWERQARACGGCFHPPTETVSAITDQRMLLSVSPTQTTLYDQIRFSGTPSAFAWVLPIHGTVEVGLSADVLFDAMDALTATRIVSPPPNCPAPTDCGGDDDTFESAGSARGSADAGSSGVTVTKQENVGPYATVQLKATDSGALTRWLDDNGYQIPADVKPIIAQYVNEGFDFLAMKLLPNQGIQAMRPVRVTSPGASLSMPLRMASVGSGATVGITIWVVSDGRYEPQNFPFFRIEDESLVWDFKTSSSNYTTLRAQHETELGNRGWEVESSIALNQQTITGTILSGGGVGGGFGGATSSASDDYLPVETGSDAGLPDEESKTAEEVRAEDVKTLFAGIAGPNARVTRMRSDILKAAMTTDLVMQASPAQDELSNVRLVTESVNLTCPVYDGCEVVGTGTLAEAQRSVGVGGGGCITTPRLRDSELALGVCVCALGLVVSRVARARRARNPRA